MYQQTENHGLEPVPVLLGFVSVSSEVQELSVRAQLSAPSATFIPAGT